MSHDKTKSNVIVRTWYAIQGRRQIDVDFCMLVPEQHPMLDRTNSIHLPIRGISSAPHSLSVALLVLP